MYLKSVDTSVSADTKPSLVDIITWVDQAYKLLKSNKVSINLKIYLKVDANTKILGILQEQIEASFIDADIIPSSF